MKTSRAFLTAFLMAIALLAGLGSAADARAIGETSETIVVESERGPGEADSLTIGERGETQQAIGGTCVHEDPCNTFIAECIGEGGTFTPIGHNPNNGRPNLGSCA